MYNENYVHVINSKKILFPKKRSSISWLLIADWVCFPDVRIWRGRVGWSEQRTGGCEGPGCLRGKQKDKLPGAEFFPGPALVAWEGRRRKSPHAGRGTNASDGCPHTLWGHRPAVPTGNQRAWERAWEKHEASGQANDSFLARQLHVSSCRASGCRTAPDSASYLLAISPAAMSAAHQESWKVKPGHLKVSDRGFAKEETELQQR